MSRMKLLAAAIGVSAVMTAGAAFAGDAESCKKVRLSDVGWTDIQATTGVAPPSPTEAASATSSSTCASPMWPTSE